MESTYKGKLNSGQRTTAVRKSETPPAEGMVKEECEEFEIRGEVEEEAKCAVWEEEPRKDLQLKEEFETGAVSLVVVSGSHATSLLERQQTEARVKTEPEGCAISRYGDIPTLPAPMGGGVEEGPMDVVLKEEPEVITWETSSLYDALEQETGNEDNSSLLMPLTSKEKAARHRERIRNDPAAREAYLAKRKESYQRRKREGKIVKPPISQLSRTEKEKIRQQWKQYQRKHRERKRATEEILNFPLESTDTTTIELPEELKPNLPNADGETILSVDVQQSRTSSTTIIQLPRELQPNPPNADGETILSLDVQQPRASSTTIIQLPRELQPNPPNADGETILSVDVQQSRASSTTIIQLPEELQPNPPNADGETILSVDVQQSRAPSTTIIQLPEQLQPNPPNADGETILSVDVQQSRAASTPPRVASRNMKWQREKAKLRGKIREMKRELEAAKRVSEKLRKRIERLRGGEKKLEKQKAKSRIARKTSRPPLSR